MIMRVSVIITTQNRPFFLKRAIYSILSQSILPYELIVIDDNSDKKFSADDINFKGINFIYHYNPRKMGGNYSRNLGVEKSSGDILMFLDDDDIWLKNKISDQLPLFETGNEFVYSGKNFVSSTNLEKVFRKSKESSNNNIWHGNYPGTTSSVAITRKTFLKAGKFDEKLQSLQDYDLWIRVIKITPAIWDEKYNINYTVHKNKNTQISTNTEKHLNSVKRIQKKYNNELKCLDKKSYSIFQSRMNHVIARSYRRNNNFLFFKYWIKSLAYKPSIRTLSLLFIA